MNILFCHTYYQLRGGEDQFFEDDVELLKARGHNVTVYSKHNDQVGERGMLRVAKDTIWNADAKREIHALIAERQPDVMHVVNTFPLISPSVFYAARQAGVPTVASIQNYRMFCAQAMCFRNGAACEDCLGKIPWRAVAHRCYRGSLAGSTVVATMQMLHRRWRTWHDYVDLICLASEFSRSKFLAQGFDPDQLRIKPNFVFPDPGQRPGGDYAVFVGRLSAEKGLPTLIEAWNQLESPPPLKLVGDGPQRDLATEAARQNRSIEWLGRLPSEEVYDVVGGAACLIFPSAGYESLPKTLVESLAVGTPAIGANIGSIPELVQPGETGLLFEVGNAQSLAQQVRDFFATPERHREMRGQCRSDYEQRFTADANYALLMNLYEEAMDRRGGRVASPVAN